MRHKPRQNQMLDHGGGCSGSSGSEAVAEGWPARSAVQVGASWRSMRRLDAAHTKPSVTSWRRSLSSWRRRLFISHDQVRSISHRLGSATNSCGRMRFTTSADTWTAAQKLRNVVLTRRRATPSRAAATCRARASRPRPHPGCRNCSPQPRRPRAAGRGCRPSRTSCDPRSSCGRRIP